jgi:hypothetical protein
LLWWASCAVLSRAITIGSSIRKLGEMRFGAYITGAVTGICSFFYQSAVLNATAMNSS